MNIFKKLFGRKNVPLPEKAKIASSDDLEHDNVNYFLANIDKKVTADSRSTLFFKEASNILGNQIPTEDSKEMLEMQSFISETDDVNEEEIMIRDTFVKEKS